MLLCRLGLLGRLMELVGLTGPPWRLVLLCRLGLLGHLMELVGLTGPPWALVQPVLLGLLVPLVLILEKPLHPKELVGLTGPPWGLVLLCRLGLHGCLMEPHVLLLMVPLGLLRLLGPHKGLQPLGLLLPRGQAVLILGMLVGLAGPPWALVPPELLGLGLPLQSQL